MTGRVRTEDGELAAKLAAGDLDALDSLYSMYGTLAFSVAVRVLNDHELAEDVVQEAFLKVWTNASSFDASRGSLRSWLLTAVRNRAIDQLRGRPGRARQEIGLAVVEDLPAQGAGSDPWREVSLAIQRDAVREALARLPDDQRTVVELAYFDGYSQKEIAERARVPVTTVKGRMRLALEKLGSYLEGRGLLDAG